MVGRPLRTFGCGRETHLKVQSRREAFPEVREAHQEVCVWSGGYPEGLGVVERPSRRSGRPTRRSGSGQEAIPKIWK